MKELAEILRLWEESERHGKPAVLATVVKVTGSAYRRPGARMLFPAGGSPAGVLSGGCLEEDLAERARDVLASGRPRIQIYDMRSPDDIVWGLGLGCNGEIRVLLERLGPQGGSLQMDFLAECLRLGRRGAMATIIGVDDDLDLAVGQRLMVGEDGSRRGNMAEGDLSARLLSSAREALASGRSTVVSIGGAAGRVEALIEHIAPPVSLFIFGAGSDAKPLVRLAKEIGWTVTVIDNRPAYATPGHFPEADEVLLLDYERLGESGLKVSEGGAAVVMTHHFLRDLRLLEFLLPRRPAYIGLLGPKKRTDNLLQELRKRGAGPDGEQLGRLYGPAGADIGSETPEEIALAIAAEIKAVLAGRPAGFLRDRREPIHDWPA